MAVNNFLPFAPTDTGTNLLTQAEYAAASDRTNGNQPGVASSKLVNKALRQAAFMSANLAQLASNVTGVDALDDANPSEMLAMLNATLLRLPSSYTNYLSGTGTHNLTYYFFIAAGNATVGATYTNSTFTYTVKTTIAAGIMLRTTGTGVPALSGTLTKATGTGDATLTFYAVRAPIELEAKLLAGGGQGGGSGAGAGSGAGGANTTFGTTLLIALGGNGGSGNGSGGGPGGGVGTVNSPAVALINLPGGGGGAATGNGATPTFSPGGNGASGPYGAAGGTNQGTGGSGGTNSGSGGAGGGANSSTSGQGAGGGAGGYIDAIISNPNPTYTFSVGAGGSGAGAAGTNGSAGGVGGSGYIGVSERFQ